MTISRLGPMYDPMRTRNAPSMPFIYIGFVKKNDDAQRMGRLSIWIPELGGDPADSGSWVIASYASPFAGATDIATIPNYANDTQVAQQSYGLWLVPPDLNNEVAVFFANGDTARAFWFACLYQQSMTHMIPGIAVNVTTEPEPPKHVSPVIEYNKANVGSTTSPRRPPLQALDRRPEDRRSGPVMREPGFFLHLGAARGTLQGVRSADAAWQHHAYR